MKSNHKKVNLTSSNLSEEKLAELNKILPEAFSENKIDWDKLRAVLGSAIDERIEKFSFTWAGKSNAIKNVLIPSKATLSPAKNESVKFDTSENLFIEGDNLEVLKLLQKAYFEQVKMIYIDPPYNTGGDFVYHDNFTAPLKNYLQQTGQVDADGNKLQTNKETSGRYHSDWLSMMYPRLKLAWNILRDDGVIFVSIGDVELANLILLMNEIFGEENKIGLVTRVQKRGGNKGNYFNPVNDYICVYAKDARNLEFFTTDVDEKIYNKTETEGLRNGEKYAEVILYMPNLDYRPNQRYFVNAPDGSRIIPPENKSFRWTKDRFEKEMQLGNVVLKKTKNSLLIDENGKQANWIVYQKRFLKDTLEKESARPNNLFEDFQNMLSSKEMEELEIPFDYPKPVELIKHILKISKTDGEDIVLDFFAGSGTAAHAVLEQNKEDGGKRKFILVQLPEVTSVEGEAYKSGYKTIADIAKERIRRVIKGYGGNPQPINAGFKVFKLSESNYPENAFEFDPEKSEEENKKAFVDYLGKTKQIKLLDDTKDIDIVYENIVKEGFSLNSKISEQKIGKNNVYLVVDEEWQLLVCLDNKIDEKTISELTGKDYKGKTFICLDSALNDTAKANLGLNVELKTI